MKLILVFAFIAGIALLFPGLPPTHDGEYHVIRFYEFDKTLRSGNWYPRWAPDLNYGYGVPLFNYVYPLPNYVAFLLHLLGFSFIDSFKLNMFFALILGSIFFYLWAKEFWGHWGGVVGTIFYTYSPYHFLDIYNRGSVGEVWALAFFPAFLWSITLFIKSRKKIYFLLSPIFFSLIIFSHNILALMFFPFAVSYVLLYAMIAKTKILFNIYYLIFTIILGLGLAAIFWLPALFERQYVTGLEIFDVTSHFPELYQLLIPSWGSGFSGAGLQNELSFQIGIANLIGVFLSLIVIILEVRKRSKIFFFTTFFMIWFVSILFLMIEASTLIWKIIPFMNYFQFPWRLLSIEILLASFLAGSIFSLKLNWLRIPLFLFLIFLAFILGIGYAKPAYYHYRDDNYYISHLNFIDGTNSPGDVFNTIWFNTNLKKQEDKLIFLKGEGKIEKNVIKTSYYSLNIQGGKDSEILVNIAYFPGWKVFVDGNEAKTDKTTDGLFGFNLSAGSHLVEIKFLDTPIRSLALLISLFSIGAIFVVSLSSRRNF